MVAKNHQEYWGECLISGFRSIWENLPIEEQISIFSVMSHHQNHRVIQMIPMIREKPCHGQSPYSRWLIHSIFIVRIKIFAIHIAINVISVHRPDYSRPCVKCMVINLALKSHSKNFNRIAQRVQGAKTADIERCPIKIHHKHRCGKRKIWQSNFDLLHLFTVILF